MNGISPSIRQKYFFLGIFKHKTAGFGCPSIHYLTCIVSNSVKGIRKRLSVSLVYPRSHTHAIDSRKTTHTRGEHANTERPDRSKPQRALWHSWEISVDSVVFFKLFFTTSFNFTDAWSVSEYGCRFTAKGWNSGSYNVKFVCMYSSLLPHSENMHV